MCWCCTTRHINAPSICSCICVSMYLSIRLYIYTHIYTHIHSHTYTPIHTHKCARVRVVWGSSTEVWFKSIWGTLMPYLHLYIYLHLPSPSKFSPFCSGGLFQHWPLSADPRALLCQRCIQYFWWAQIVEFVSFTGAFTSKYVVKETYGTVHSIRKETCQKVIRFHEPYTTTCFWGVKETWKEGNVDRSVM